MLFTPIVRPLDLGGTAELNRAVDERHVIDSDAARIFVPQLGPFFKDSMTIVDVKTGKQIKEFDDYRLIHMVTEATQEANKEINCVVYITNPIVGEVLISYQAIGGIYAEGSIALIEILDRFRQSKLPPVYWSQIINLPDAFPVTPHRHTMYDLDAIDRAISALTKVLDRIYARDIPKFQTLFDNLDKNINDLLSKGDNDAQYLEQGFMRIESNSLYRKGQVKVTDNNQNPYDYLGYGSWSRLEEVLLYGAALNDPNDPIYTVANTTGHVARITNMWEQVSDIDGISILVTASATNINEGQSVTFTVQTSGLNEGTRIPYKLTGVNEDDIIGELTGDFIINNVGTGTVTIKTVEDLTTEGVEILTLYLVEYPSIRRAVNINDTSRSPSYTIRYTSDIEGKNIVTAVDEGQKFYIFVQSEFVSDGQVINLFYNGSTTTNADFNANLPTTLTISGGRAVQEVTVKNDQLTEANESLVTGVSVSSADAILVSAVLSIRDTSKAPLYNIIYTVSNTNIIELSEVGEGVDFWCIVQTENIANGTVLSISNAGTTNDADFEVKFPTSVTINNNTASFKMRMRNDLTTEGQETVGISLMIGGTSVYTKLLAINDTSANPNANMKFSTNSSGTNSVSTANEGTKVYLVVETQSMPNGTVFNLVYSGTAEASDFDTARPTTVTINNNRGVVEYSIKADKLTDNRVETLIVSLQNSFSREMLGSVTLSINDTSKASTYKLRFSSSSAGTGTITSANEGTTVYAVIETTDVADNTTLNIATTIGGKVATVANGDVTVNVATTAKIVGNKAIVNINLNNDLANEGAESLVMTVSEGTTTVATATMTVNDTSKAPTYSGRLLVGNVTTAPTASSAAATNILVGNKYGIYVQTANVPDGAVLHVRTNAAVETNTTRYLPTGAFTSPPNLSAAPPASITIKGNVAWIPFQIYGGFIDTADSVFTIGLYTAASGGSPVVKITAKVLLATYELYWASDAAGATRVTAVDEGKSAHLIIKHPNTPAGVILKTESFVKDVSQKNTPNADVLNSGLASITLGTSLTAKSHSFVADELKEGNEVFRVRVWPDHTVGTHTPAWFKDASITITDSSYRANKVRAGAVTGQVNVITNAVEHFGTGTTAVFLTPEGQHEGWTYTRGDGNLNLKSDIYDRAGTVKTPYSGLTNWVALDLRQGAVGSAHENWQKSYHNEIVTYVGKNVAQSIPGVGELNNAVAFCTPTGDNSSMYVTRTESSIELHYTVMTRIGTDTRLYLGEVNITAMKPYLPHEGTHVDAPYPRVVMASSGESLFKLHAPTLLPYNFNDTSKYAIMFNPDVAHEGWRLSRAGAASGLTASITAEVYRQVVNGRMNITDGNMNWAVIQLKADNAIDDAVKNMSVKGKSKTVNLIKDHVYEIKLLGGGGGGGNTYNNVSILPGNSTGLGGGTSRLTITNILTVEATGGGGGAAGIFTSNSSYRNGAHGTGGTAKITNGANLAANLEVLSSTIVNGAAATVAYVSPVNPSRPEPDMGIGGAGAASSSGTVVGAGGSGGAGGYIVLQVKAKANMTATIIGGVGGDPMYSAYDPSTRALHKTGNLGKTGVAYIKDLGIINASAATITLAGTTTDGTWSVAKEEVKIYDRAKAVLGRNPTAYDNITVVVPANVAIVAPSVTAYALNFAGFPAGTKITLNCTGMVLGHGGMGATDRNPQVGGKALFNDGNAVVTLNAIGAAAKISGGGGGGGGSYVTSSAKAGGGGGAPYGLGQNNGANATLITGGNGGPTRGASGIVVQGGKGGDIGQDGVRGEFYGSSVNTHLYGAAAGVATQGNGFSAINKK